MAAENDKAMDPGLATFAPLSGQMLRCAKELGLKARAPKTKWERLANTPLPGIAVLRDGGFIILGKVVLCPCLAAVLSRKIAVGTLITERPPHRSERAQLRHSAPTLRV